MSLTNIGRRLTDPSGRFRFVMTPEGMRDRTQDLISLSATHSVRPILIEKAEEFIEVLKFSSSSFETLVNLRKLNTGGLMMHLAEGNIRNTPDVRAEINAENILLNLADKVLAVYGFNDRLAKEVFREQLKIIITEAGGDERYIQRRQRQSIQRALGRNVPGGTFTPSLFQRKAKRKKNLKKK